MAGGIRHDKIRVDRHISRGLPQVHDIGPFQYGQRQAKLYGVGAHRLSQMRIRFYIALTTALIAYGYLDSRN